MQFENVSKIDFVLELWWVHKPWNTKIFIFQIFGEIMYPIDHNLLVFNLFAKADICNHFQLICNILRWGTSFSYWCKLLSWNVTTLLLIHNSIGFDVTKLSLPFHSKHSVFNTFFSHFLLSVIGQEAFLSNDISLCNFKYYFLKTEHDWFPGFLFARGQCGMFTVYQTVWSIQLSLW